jgi:hypothetical protein
LPIPGNFYGEGFYCGLSGMVGLEYVYQRPRDPPSAPHSPPLSPLNLPEPFRASISFPNIPNKSYNAYHNISHLFIDMTYYPFTQSTQEYVYSNLDIVSISNEFLSNMIPDYPYVISRTGCESNIYLFRLQNYLWPTQRHT